MLKPSARSIAAAAKKIGAVSAVSKTPAGAPAVRARPVAGKVEPAPAKSSAKSSATPSIKSSIKSSANPASIKSSAKSSAKPSIKPAPRSPARVPRAPAAAAPAAKDKLRKEKLVRDSFTMPEGEYAVLGQVKKACLKAGFEIKKSELLRIGVALISQIDLATLQKVLGALPQLKTGRPKKL